MHPLTLNQQAQNNNSWRFSQRDLKQCSACFSRLTGNSAAIQNFTWENFTAFQQEVPGKQGDGVFSAHTDNLFLVRRDKEVSMWNATLLGVSPPCRMGKDLKGDESQFTALLNRVDTGKGQHWQKYGKWNWQHSDFCYPKAIIQSQYNDIKADAVSQEPHCPHLTVMTREAVVWQ